MTTGILQRYTTTSCQLPTYKPSTNWNKQEYRVRAEREYATLKPLLHKPPTSAEEASMQFFREVLDIMLEYQANDAPPMSLHLRIIQEERVV
jgi:hypothetical protein